MDGGNEGKPSAILTSPLEITNVFKTVLGFKVTVADYKGDTLLWLRRYFIRLQSVFHNILKKCIGLHRKQGKK